VRVSLTERTLRFAAPLATSFGVLEERDLLELRLTGEDGVSGHGEAAPLEPYDGIPTAIVRAALERYLPILEAGDGASGSELLDACRAAADLPQALAAVDLALWDRAGRRAGRPLCELLSDDPARRVVVNATLGATDRLGAAEQASAAVAAGYTCLKVKVGVGDDGGRVAAVRARAGPTIALRLDANGAWMEEEAVRAIEALAPAGLEFVEEPVSGLQAMRSVRARVSVRVAMDETAAMPGALASGAADAVCLKISRCGGISGLLAAAALVSTTGAEAYLASTFDGPLGIAGALHAAAALTARSALPACGLATLGAFSGLVDPFSPVGGAIAVPTGPGLGVTV